MKTPKRIRPLVENGLVDEVIGSLMSGKEADVFVVRCGSEIRCAKVYKEAGKRAFKQAVTYQEGRKVRNSRRGRAMEKGSKFGREQQEEEWQSAEVTALYKLADIGVRVPKPYGCFDGVLLMELITYNGEEVAPRLNDVSMTEEQALADHKTLMHDIMRMLCAGLVHGDLSPFNVLIDDEGPVIIDLPQAVDAAANNNAEKMHRRDVENITHYYAQYAPELNNTRYAPEMWALFEAGDLLPNTQLTGHFEENTETADVDTVLEEISQAYMEEQSRLERIRKADTGE
ncbi:MAG: phosphotransferase [Gammaproteobacteria bacterium]|nr:phosphotransferase [Gammaproteobacteria bacterium]